MLLMVLYAASKGIVEDRQLLLRISYITILTNDDNWSNLFYLINFQNLLQMKVAHKFFSISII